MVSAAIVSFVVSAFLIPNASFIANWLTRKTSSKAASEESTGDAKSSPDVVIIGFGPAGQLATQPLVDCPLCVLVIDLNHQNVKKAKQLGFQAQLGDASQSEILDHANVKNCQVAIITVPHFKSSINILDMLRQQNPQIHIIVRSRYDLNINDFVKAGADVVQGDEHQVGKSIAQHVQSWVDKSKESRSSAKSEPIPSTPVNGTIVESWRRRCAWLHGQVTAPNCQRQNVAEKHGYPFFILPGHFYSERQHNN